MPRLRWLIVLIAISAPFGFATSPANADLMYISGRLHAFARADSPNMHTMHAPIDILIGPGMFITYIHGAHTSTGTATSVINISTTRLPEKLTQTLDGQTTTDSSLDSAQASGAVTDLFDLSEPGTIRLDAQASSTDFLMGIRVEDTAGSILFNRPQILGPDTFFLDLPQGRFSLITTGSFSTSGQPQPAGHGLTVMTLVPEPSGLCVISLAAPALFRRRRARQDETCSIN